VGEGCLAQREKTLNGGEREGKNCRSFSNGRGAIGQDASAHDGGKGGVVTTVEKERMILRGA